MFIIVIINFLFVKPIFEIFIIFDKHIYINITFY